MKVNIQLDEVDVLSVFTHSIFDILTSFLTPSTSSTRLAHFLEISAIEDNIGLCAKL